MRTWEESGSTIKKWMHSGMCLSDLPGDNSCSKLPYYLFFLKREVMKEDEKFIWASGVTPHLIVATTKECSELLQPKRQLN